MLLLSGGPQHGTGPLLIGAGAAVQIALGAGVVPTSRAHPPSPSLLAGSRSLGGSDSTVYVPGNCSSLFC
jgi:hypothetical protein